ncbi:hypothetical protein QVD17_14139 [Tagetes erecta]|uniref:Uncharacterized protein n=1 Tax=Tagetes erecta TaxID=13708 RepID=A0AAD8KXU9_TARER|nr:hypothetical protein QVD17_14139 [Tagetes erecta]
MPLNQVSVHEKMDLNPKPKENGPCCLMATFEPKSNFASVIFAIEHWFSSISSASNSRHCTTVSPELICCCSINHLS